MSVQIELERFEAVLFDFDKTLADSPSLYEPARIEACTVRAEQTGDERYLAIPPEVHHQAHMMGTNSYEITERVLAQVGIVRIGEERPPENDPVLELLDIRKEIYWGMIQDEKLQPIPGSVEFVRGVAEIIPGCLGIVTTGNREREVMPFLAQQNLTGAIDEALIVDGNDVKSKELKPHPAAYYLGLDRLLLMKNPRAVVAIEDLPKGIEAANRALLFSIGIATTHSVTELRLLEGMEKPDLVIGDFDKLGMIMLAGTSEAATI